MMQPAPTRIAEVGAWIATGLGAGMWIWMFVKERDPIRRVRLNDCGVVLVFSAILTRVVIDGRPLDPFDWAFLILSPLFIAAALWRLARTQGMGR